MGLNNAKENYLAETLGNNSTSIFVRNSEKWFGCIHFQTLFLFPHPENLRICIAGEGEGRKRNLIIIQERHEIGKALDWS